MLKKQTALLLSLFFTAAFLFFLFLSHLSSLSPGSSVRPARVFHAEDARIDINTADIDELQQLPGIGSSLSEAIILWREEHGPFQSEDELTEVPGIGEKTVNGLRNYIVVGGSDEDTGRG